MQNETVKPDFNSSAYGGLEKALVVVVVAAAAAAILSYG